MVHAPRGERLTEPIAGSHEVLRHLKDLTGLCSGKKLGADRGVDVVEAADAAADKMTALFTKLIETL